MHVLTTLMKMYTMDIVNLFVFVYS